MPASHAQSDPNAPVPGKRLLFVGGSGHHYLRNLLEVGAEGMMLVDPADAAGSQAFAQRHRIEIQTGTLAEVASEFAPDVVSVGAIYAYNVAYVTDALRLGLPVVSDKPIATTRQQLAEIEAIVAQPGAPALVTEFDWRSRPSLRAARAAVAEGRIGPVVLAVGQKSYRFGTRPAWYADASMYCGTMLWIASHALDAIAFTLGADGEPPRVVFARGGNVSREAYGSMEDHVTATLALPRGGTGIVHADLLNPAASPTHGKDRLRLVGGQGEVLVEEGRCILTTDDQPPTDITSEGEQGASLAGRLLAAALGTGDDGDYGTQASLLSARLMLSAQEALAGVDR